MNRKQRIIVSVTGIFIVLLALLGLTFAYFLTKITGNENPKSISVTTAKLELVYGDNSAEIINGTGALMPTLETEADDAIGTKTFTVTNNGNDSSYVVVIDNVETKYATNGSYKDENGNTITHTKDQETEFLSNDFRYTLTCSVKDKSGNIKNDEKCNDVNSLSIFPINGGILVGNAIPEDRIHEYTLTLWYIDNGKNQSNDMNKTYQARVNIQDINRMENPFKTGIEATDKANLAYNIIENAKTNKNGTEFVNNPLTTPAEQMGGVVNYKTTAEEPSIAGSMSLSNYETNKTWYYYDTYVVDETTGKFTLSGKRSCTYNSTTTNTDGEIINCYDDIKGNYLVTNYEEYNYDANNHTADTQTDLYQVFKVTSATATTLNYVYLFNSPNEVERVLVPTIDDYGTSYYFRGDVKDNYVNFAGMCWRIVRIEGDGSVKLILEDRNEQCNDKEGQDLNNNGTYFTGNWSGGEEDYYVFGYDDNYKADFINYEGGLADSFKTFQTSKLTSTDLQKLKVDEWCYDDTVANTGTSCLETEVENEYGDLELVERCYTDEYYGAYTRIETNKTPSLNCIGTKLTKFRDGTDMYVATLTADEMSFAGAYSDGFNYYLMNNYTKDNYLYWWMLSPSYLSGGMGNAFSFDDAGCFFSGVGLSDFRKSRPAVSLKSGSVITSGEGTQEKPYIIG